MCPNFNEEAAANVVSDFGRAFLHAAVEAPSQGVAQLINEAWGRKVLPEDVQLLQPADAAPAFSARWHAQQAGTGVGMILPLALSSAGVRMVGKCTASTARVLGISERLAVPSQNARMLGTAAMTGATFDTVFTPIESNSANFWEARARNALCGAATFGVISAAGHELRTLRTPQNNLSGQAMYVTREIGVNAIAGATGGVANVLTRSLLDGTAPSAEKLVESAYSFAILGGTMRAKDMALKGRSAVPVEGRSAAPTEGPGAVPVEGRSAAPTEGPGAAPIDGRGAGPVEGRSAAPIEGRGAAPIESQPTTAGEPRTFPSVAVEFKLPKNSIGSVIFIPAEFGPLCNTARAKVEQTNSSKAASSEGSGISKNLPIDKTADTALKRTETAETPGASVSPAPATEPGNGITRWIPPSERLATPQDLGDHQKRRIDKK